MDDPPTERMPIACHQCAKAKAKCDKKIPCSRCVGKQIVCQTRATRRSSHNPNRRHLPRQHSERALHTSATFHVSQLSSSNDVPPIAPNTFTHPPLFPHRHSFQDIPSAVNQMPIYSQDMDPHFVRNVFTTSTSPDTIPITPIMPHVPHLDNFISMNGHFDHEGDQQFLNIGNQSGMLDFDTGVVGDFTTPPSLIHDMQDQFLLGKSVVQTPSVSINLHSSEGSMPTRSHLDLSSPQSFLRKSSSAPSSIPSMSTTGGLREPDAVIASHQAWPFFQCNPVERPSFSPPKTAILYLEGLAQTLKNEETWHTGMTQLDENILDRSTNLSTEPMFGASREKLLAIAQSFLHKALDIHKAERGIRDDSPRSPDCGRGIFLMLPPPGVVQYFLKSYVARYEPYYPSVSASRMNPNALMQSKEVQAASLLVLLMIASGASATPTVEARYLTSGLTEACRISLFDTVEKDVMQSRNPLVLRSALLFTSLAAWSGDKWHMDIAMGQRGLYIAMLTHASMLEPSTRQVNVSECRYDQEKAWEEWKEAESRHRLTYSWILVDQEMSLFSDSMPLLSIDNLLAPMPDAEELWQVSSASEWLTMYENIRGTVDGPLSPRDLFARFVDGDLIPSASLSATQLRLLLQPLQALVCQLRQFMSCFPDGSSHARASRGVSRAAIKARLAEVSALLQQWYVLSRESFVHSKQQPCWTACTNLIIYHLISLNTVTSFKTIEQFGRREVVLEPFRHSQWLQTRCIDNVEESYFHCGQILRLIKSMPVQVRPPWWAGAIYRVALTGWATSMANSANSRYPGKGQSCESDKIFPIDNVTPEHDSLSRYLKCQEGIPMLSRSDGSLLSMDVPAHVVNYCIDILEDDSSMRLADGIKRKLRSFVSNWKET